MEEKFNPTSRDYGMIAWKKRVDLKAEMNPQR
jgi:hypothetical protein